LNKPGYKKVKKVKKLDEPSQMGPLDRANFNHWTYPTEFINTVQSVESNRRFGGNDQPGLQGRSIKQDGNQRDARSKRFYLVYLSTFNMQIITETSVCFDRNTPGCIP
jgi:hypothetical protein